MSSPGRQSAPDPRPAPRLSPHWSTALAIPTKRDLGESARRDATDRRTFRGTWIPSRAPRAMRRSRASRVSLSERRRASRAATRSSWRTPRPVRSRTPTHVHRNAEVTHRGEARSCPRCRPGIQTSSAITRVRPCRAVRSVSLSLAPGRALGSARSPRKPRSRSSSSHPSPVDSSQEGSRDRHPRIARAFRGAFREKTREDAQKKDARRRRYERVTM